MSELIDQLRKRAEEIGSDWSDHSMLLTVISVIERQQAEIERLRTAINRALADSESGKGWGPDVTVCAYLREALNRD